MAHFTKLNNDNIVTEILVVGDGDILKADGTQSELKGKQFLNSLFGTATWKQTFEDGSSRKNYAGIGYTYDFGRDAFIPPKPFPSWLLDEPSCLWKAPVEYPDDGDKYSWDEENQEWDLTQEIAV